MKHARRLDERVDVVPVLRDVVGEPDSVASERRSATRHESTNAQSTPKDATAIRLQSPSFRSHPDALRTSIELPGLRACAQHLGLPFANDANHHGARDVRGEDHEPTSTMRRSLLPAIARAHAGRPTPRPATSAATRDATAS